MHLGACFSLNRYLEGYPLQPDLKGATQTYFFFIIAIGIYNVGRPTLTVALRYNSIPLLSLWRRVTEATSKKEGWEVLLELLFFFFFASVA